MVNYDLTVPKLDVTINILMKKHHILTESGVERIFLQSPIEQHVLDTNAGKQQLKLL